MSAAEITWHVDNVEFRQTEVYQIVFTADGFSNNLDDSAPFADDGQRPTKFRRLDANAPISSMCVAYPVLLECGPCRRQTGQSWRPTAVYVAAAVDKWKDE